MTRMTRMHTATNCALAQLPGPTQGLLYGPSAAAWRGQRLASYAARPVGGAPPPRGRGDLRPNPAAVRALSESALSESALSVGGG